MRQSDRVREQRYNTFLHGLDNNNLNTGSCPPMDERELTARIRNLTRGMRSNTTTAAIFMIAAVAGFFFIGPFAFALGIVSGFFGLNAMFYKNRLKCLVSSNIVRGVLSDTFELTHYAPGCHIGQSTIKESMLIQRNWNNLSGSDMVEGFYKGVRFRFSDIHLEQVTRSKNGKKRVTVFKGQWLIIGLAKTLPWSLQLRSRLSVGKRAKSNIETENMEFNSRFQIQCGDPHTAFYILTPHFMEYILNAKSKASTRPGYRADAQTHMNFCGKEVHVALHNGRDLFEPCGRKLFATDNITALRMQMEWDVNYIKSIIEELLLNENLFATNEKEN